MGRMWKKNKQQKKRRRVAVGVKIGTYTKPTVRVSTTELKY